MRISTCRECGADIVRIKTAGGKSMPCDAAPVYYVEKPKTGTKKIITKNGEVISCEYAVDFAKATGIGYIPHEHEREESEK